MRTPGALRAEKRRSVANSVLAQAVSLLLLVLASGRSLSGETPVRVQADSSSACTRALTFVTDDAARNYVGFADKVNPSTAAEYGAMVDHLRNVSRGSASPEACLSVLRQWTGFFRDPHLMIELRERSGTAGALDEIPASVTRLDSRTLLLRLRNFDYRDADVVRGLIRTVARMSGRTENLILDLRDNSGGSDFAWQPLLPLVYTGPMKVLGTAFYSTPENVSRMAAQLGDPELDGLQRQWLEHTVDAMRTHPGQFVRQPDVVYRAEGVLPYPRRVAVLINHGCASSCEQLLMALRQSRKVTLYGERTAGALDYSNLVAAAVPGGEFELVYPISRSKRLPAAALDDRGIAPDVRVPASAPSPVAWVRRRLPGGPLNTDGSRPEASRTRPERPIARFQARPGALSQRDFDAPTRPPMR